MSDGLNPKGPAQPTLDQAYETVGNPTSKEPAEKVQSDRNATDQSQSTDQRTPQKQAPSIDKATPTSMARGVRGAGPGEEAAGRTQEDVGQHRELDADQMAAPGEGKVADAVNKHPGASGQQPGFESDLDRKKAEQKPMRDNIQSEKEQNFEAGGVLGQRGGPANPVDKDNYPNTNKQ